MTLSIDPPESVPQLLHVFVALVGVSIFSFPFVFAGYLYFLVIFFFDNWLFCQWWENGVGRDVGKVTTLQHHCKQCINFESLLNFRLWQKTKHLKIVYSTVRHLSICISATCWLTGEPNVPDGTSSQVLRLTSVDVWHFRAWKFLASKFTFKIAMFWGFYLAESY